MAYLVAATHGLPTDDYTFAYVTGWAAGVDRAEPERVVRDTGARVLAAGRAVLAATQPEATAAGAELAAGAQAGTERTAAARAHAAATLALAQPAAVDPAAAAVELAALARLHADAAAFYTAQLAAGSPDAARAAALLTARAVPPTAVAGYQLGYAPPGWTALVDHLRARGYTDAQLLDAGVGLRTRRGTVVDRFRDRLMFPVRDPGGQRIVGFLGRALVEAEDTPRYLNSPATALYRKGEVLYGLGAEPGRQALAGDARPVLVEGPLDAIAVTCAAWRATTSRSTGIRCSRSRRSPTPPGTPVPATRPRTSCCSARRSATPAAPAGRTTTAAASGCGSIYCTATRRPSSPLPTRIRCSHPGEESTCTRSRWPGTAGCSACSKG